MSTPPRERDFAGSPFPTGELRTALLPLPKGEGWGEGEKGVPMVSRAVHWFNARKVSENCLPERKVDPLPFAGEGSDR